jgi:hypothetical protein
VCLSLWFSSFKDCPISRQKGQGVAGRNSITQGYLHVLNCTAASGHEGYGADSSEAVEVGDRSSDMDEFSVQLVGGC